MRNFCTSLAIALVATFEQAAAQDMPSQVIETLMKAETMNLSGFEADRTTFRNL